MTDDNIINQKVAARLLQQFGYSADIASNGLEAVTAVQRQPYDLVFMDVQMPGMDGLTATRQIREWEGKTKRPPITIIAMTANAMVGDRAKCIASGMNDYLAKPVRPDALKLLIEKYATTPSQPFSSAEVPVAPTANVTPPVQKIPEEPSIDAEAIDLDRLIEFSGGSRTSLFEITDLYLTQTREQLRRMQGAGDLKDSAALARLAHSSAGASGVCGLLTMEALFRQVEMLAKEQRIDDIVPLLAELSRQFERARTFLLNSREKLPLS